MAKIEVFFKFRILRRNNFSFGFDRVSNNSVGHKNEMLATLKSLKNQKQWH